MIIHIAIYKWKKGVSKKKISKALNEIRKLKNKVPGLIDIKCGPNFSRYGEGYTHAIVVLAKNRKALDAYRKHPYHVKVAKEIERMEERGIGVDLK